jgi:hypothetical protein
MASAQRKGNKTEANANLYDVLGKATYKQMPQYLSVVKLPSALYLQT